MVIYGVMTLPAPWMIWNRIEKKGIEMKRIIFLVLFSVFAICGPAYCHTFKAVDVSEGGAEAVLRDTITGDEWVVQVGDEIDGYRVVQITMEYVTIDHPGENGVFYSTEIPISRANHTIKVSP
jgi:hypothetical protein